jgi:hypothetical protein
LLLVPTAYVFISPFHFSSRFSFSLQILAWRPAGFRSGTLLGSLLGLRLALCSTLPMPSSNQLSHNQTMLFAPSSNSNSNSNLHL